MSAYETLRAELKQTPRTWLVTGAAGFIGSNLVAALEAKGAEVAIGPLTRDVGTRLAFIRGPDGIMVEIVQKR